MQSEYLDCFNQINFEKIIDHPNILIAAKFWDHDRYMAAKTCYRIMRQIDDLIDNYKAEHQGIARDKRVWFREQVNHWLKILNGTTEVVDDTQAELVNTFRAFSIPLWPFEDFAQAMQYDIDQDGFSTFDKFIKYSQGASVAPSSIFVHLCGLTNSNGKFIAPSFDVKAAARPSALFSYIVHIIRDFQKDQIDNLSYFADDLIVKHGLSREILKEIAYGAALPDGFRNLIREYMGIAENYRQETIGVIERISPLLEPRNQLSLHIIYNLYNMVYERIDADHGTFTSVELNPTAQEIREEVKKTIEEFGKPDNHF